MQLPNLPLTFLLFVTTFWADVGGKKSTHGMDSKTTCLDTSVKLEFLEDGDSSIVVGKNNNVENQARSKQCKVRFKAISKKGRNYLSLKFDNFYINDCGVTLTISQSRDTTFQEDITDLIHLKCEQRNPRILYAKEDYTVQFKLTREDIFLRNYNFRINVSLSDGPPKAGPSVAVIIGISAALLAVIAVIAFILIKYIRLKNSVLRERRAERAIESALYVYGSQELGSPDVSPYITPVPGQRSQNGANPHIGTHSNGHVHGSTSPNHDERQSLLIGPPNSMHTNGHTPRSISKDMMPLEFSSKDPLDVEGELPPSYEEALEMPKPPDSPIYANT